MGSLRTVLLALSLLLPAGTAGAQASVQMELHMTFATCTGRLSAKMEFEWLLSDPTANRTEADRAAMIALLQATTPPDERRLTLARRIEAKRAHSALLTRAFFNEDPQDAQWAIARAERIIASCTGMLLS